MLEKNLETCLNNSFKKAHADGHEFVTTEHLLLSLLDNEDALNLLASCDAVSYTHLTLPTSDLV